MSRCGKKCPLMFLSAVALLAVPAAAFPQQAETAQEAPSLYDRLGGLPAIAAVVSDFIDVLKVDSLLNQNPAIDAARKRVPAAYLKYRVTSLVCQVTGGPCQYQGRGMKEAHAHLNITESEWYRMVALFKEVLAKYNVPEQETNELLSIVESTKGDIVVSGGDS